MFILDVVEMKVQDIIFRFNKDIVIDLVLVSMLVFLDSFLFYFYDIYIFIVVVGG